MTVAGLILIGLLAGSIVGTLGIGGGIIYVPSLVTLFSVAQHQAQGTSLAIIVPTTLVAAIVHSRAGRVEWRTSALMAVGAVLGASLGARLALSLDADLLRRLFGIMVAITAVRMLHRTRKVAAD